jgi:hypothetical protein
MKMEAYLRNGIVFSSSLILTAGLRTYLDTTGVMGFVNAIVVILMSSINEISLRYTTSRDFVFLLF